MDAKSKERSLTGTTGTWGAIWNIMMLSTLVATNMLALYSLSISRDVQRSLLLSPIIHSTSDHHSTSILQELASVREELRNTQQSLLKMMDTMQQQQEHTSRIFDHESSSISISNFSPLSHELLEFTAERKLPLGRNPNYGLETMVSPIGHHCYSHRELLDKYMNYTAGSSCPDDWDVAQALMVRGCEPLPRRRCFSVTPHGSYSEPGPVPGSLWSTPKDDTVSWTHYSCKSYECLKNRAKKSGVFYDCADCFDLEGPERSRWVSSRDFMSLDEVLSLKSGRIRIGLDIGGGSASFAARMLEHNVTIVTSTLNLNGPFNEFVASRGIVPLYLTISQRLPFFDNTLDLVHTMHVLSNWLPNESLEFILFDIDRILRPKGLFWLDHFFCTQNQLEALYIPMVEKLGYRKLKWITNKKLDKNGVMNNEVYLSALLEKPLR